MPKSSVQEVSIYCVSGGGGACGVSAVLLIMFDFELGVRVFAFKVVYVTKFGGHAIVFPKLTYA